MLVNKTSSVEEYKIASRFDSLRKILKTEEFSRHMEKPLAYWALPTDRRLPLVLLGRTLKDLLNMSFAELAATPGIGQKKIRSFVGLLARAANTDPSELAMDELKSSDGDATGGSDKPKSPKGFDPSGVSEVVWSQWRATVVKYGLERETLGRLAPSLRSVTRVNWDTPLSEFTAQTLAEIKARKTHGEKRVHSLLEVFHELHNLVSGMGKDDHLVVRICPHRIDAVQSWIAETLQSSQLPSEDEIMQKFIQPLLDQIHVDATEQVAALADDRVGLQGSIDSVREVARKMDLTRARVYQLLNEINDIMQVRWPTGRMEVYALLAKLQTAAAAAGKSYMLCQLQAAIELFYPNNRRGGAALDQTAFAEDEPLPEGLLGNTNAFTSDIDTVGA